ncbi:MAG TPA: lipopolysaccharide biosynthesis protein [Blastocatellia bacterium]|nr:lipopolysaccharide biosynthesis protein [Blastocatellia bacterium]
MKAESDLAIGLRLGETTRQAGLLFSAHTVSMGAGFLSGLVMATWMEPAELGRFTLCLTIVVLAGLFFEVGIFSSGSRVLALAADQESERRGIGAMVLMAAGIGIALSIFIAAAAIPIELIFHADVRWALITAAAFVFLQPFHQLVEQCCQGLNRIRTLSVFQLLNSGSNLLVLIALALTGTLNAVSALISYLAAIGIASAWTLIQLRPMFDDNKRFIKLTLKETRAYGLNIYLSRITGNISTRFDNLAIAYFLVDLAPLGMYAIAQKLSSPIVTIARVVAITRFRAFTKLSRVPPRIVRWNAGVLLVTSASLALAGPLFLGHIFPKYSEAALLLVPFAAWNLFAGLFQPYQMFLASHGRGSEIRNITAIVALAGSAGVIAVVPRYGIMGAAWTAAGAMALDYVLTLYYYQRFRRTLE